MCSQSLPRKFGASAPILVRSLIGRGSKLASGASWMLLFKAFERGAGIISVLVLARFLAPGDFGLVAIATSVVALLELFNSFSFDVALISRSEIDETHYNTAWTLNIIMASLIAVMIVAISPLAVAFYREAKLVEVLYVLAVAALVQGFENVGVVDFRRRLLFRKEFTFLAAKRLATFGIVISLALTLRNYWALVIGILSGRLIGVLLSYLMHPLRPRMSLRAHRDLLGFSKWMLLNNLISFLKERSPEFVIGRLAGVSAVGLYSIGSELAQLPTSEVVAPINRAILPNFASTSRDGQALAGQYLKVVGVIALVIVPAGAGLAAVAEIAVPILVGDQWHGAVPVIQILACHGIIAGVQSVGFSVMLACNRPDVPAKLNLIHAILLLALLIAFTSLWGIIGAASAYLVVGILMAPINMALVLSTLKAAPRKAVAQLWRPVIAGVTMALIVASTLPADQFSLSTQDRILTLVWGVSLGASVYLVLMFLLWRMNGRPIGAETELLGWILQKWRERNAGRS